MKFRYKVLVVNIILLAISLGTVGYLMIRQNFNLAQKTGLSHAIMENNLLQSSVEYELLQVLNGSEYQGQESLSDKELQIRDELKQIGERLKGGMMAANTSFYIRYDNINAYKSDEVDEVPAELFYNMKVGEKNYILREENGENYIYVTSSSLVGQDYLCVINKSNISDNYKTLTIQIWYFRVVILLVLAVAGMLMYLASRYLTRPLEQLTRASAEIAREHYSQRVSVTSRDEVGQLAEQFNDMAGAVENHIVQLREMVENRERFVADFTHEIKTPMTTIIGYADTMRSIELPRQEQMLALNYIFSEGKRLEDMSGKLFELIYLKKKEIACMPVHVTDFILEVRQITVPMLACREIALETEVEDGTININRELFVTVFINLIDNARKASKQGDRIQIQGQRFASEEQSGYEFRLIDHGIGMTRDEVRQMCDEFYMADKSRTRKEGGAGLGMALVSLILDRHGATWTVESEPGRGTLIRIRLDEGRQS